MKREDLSSAATDANPLCAAAMERVRKESDA